MSNEKILIVDDDSHICNAIAESLKMEGYGIVTAATGEEALEILKKDFLNIVLSDLKMPGMNGVEVLKQVKKLSPDTEVILMTAYGTVETAVGAMKLGAYDYITKPIDLSELDFLIIRCLEKQRLTQEVGEFKELVNLYEVSRAIGSVMKLQDLLDFIIKLACETLSADGGSTMLIDEKTNELTAVATEGIEREEIPLIKIGNGIIGNVARSGENYFAQEIKQFERFHPHHPVVCIPLKIKEHVIGVIAIYKLLQQKPNFSQLDYELFTLLAGHAATSIFSSKLYCESERKLSTIQGFINLLTK